MTRYRYAARLNSFLTRPESFWPGRAEKPGTFDLIERAASADGLNAVDVNYPQQTAGIAHNHLADSRVVGQRGGAQCLATDGWRWKNKSRAGPSTAFRGQATFMPRALVPRA